MKIRISSQEGIEAFEDLADEFLRDILDHEGALITDRSWITDFIDFGLQGPSYEEAKEKIWKKIEDKYHVDVRGEINILAILRKIHAPKGHA